MRVSGRSAETARHIGSFLPKTVRFVAVSLLLSGVVACKGNGIDFSAVMPENVGQQRSGTFSEQQLEAMGRQYDKKPGEKASSLRYAQALRQSGRHAQAVAVLQQTSIANVNDSDVAAAYGKALADIGRVKEAAEVLARAHTPDRPNWRVLSAQGAVEDQQGEHARAQEFYQAALQVMPNEPTVLANLGLSYVLSSRLNDAEKVLSQAVADPRADHRVRANYALVLALQGKYKESEEVASRDLSPQEAAANIAEIRRMAVQPNTWQQIRKTEGAKPAKAERG